QGQGRSGIDAVAGALVKTMDAVSRVTDRPGDQKPTSMNFMVTDGELLVATRCHRTLFFTPPADEGATVQQLVIASEELSSESHWREVAEGELVGVDGGMAFRRWTR
ncbi:MAG TPA: class II glutamine amidotransferase, partial [Myxococcaceae bacterium]|nr:class II glutamine amidotransferase [Myxococcaceae bacterium]